MTFEYDATLESAIARVLVRSGVIAPRPPWWRPFARRRWKRELEALSIQVSR